MARKFLVNIDMSKNQILNLVLQILSSAPATPAQGQIYYNSSDNKIYYYNSNAWAEVGAGGEVLTADGATIEIVGGVIRIKDVGVTTAKIADSSVTTIKLTDKNVTFSKIEDIATMNVRGRVAGGAGSASAIPIINDLSTGAAATNIATAGSIKTYIDNAVTALGNLQGSLDANAATEFPASAGGTTKGDYWYVTVAGAIQGINLNVGDVIIAAVDAASLTVTTEWIFLESNRETATQPETDAGTNDFKIVTPLKLKTYLDTRVGSYNANVGDASATSFVLTHSLDTLDLSSTVYEVSTGKEVIADVEVTSTSTITVSFAVAPSANQYRVVIKK